MEKTLRNLSICLLPVMIGCKIASVDYAVGQVKLVNKIKTTVDGKPAVSLIIRNEGEEDVATVIITVKAKRKQVDLSVQTVVLDRLHAHEVAKRTVIFSNLNSHEDYDLITYAVNFSSSPTN